MVNGKQKVSALTWLEEVKTRLQNQSKLKSLQPLAYRGTEEAWFDGYTISNRYVTIKVVGNEMWAKYEDRDDWLYVGHLRK